MTIRLLDNWEHETLEAKARWFQRKNIEERLEFNAAWVQFVDEVRSRQKMPSMLERITSVFAALEAHQAKYVVIGGIAAILYGIPRVTGDLDILIEASPENARRVLGALIEVGYDMANLVDPSGLIEVKYISVEDGIRVDIFTQIPGIDFETAWQNRTMMYHFEQAFYVVSKADLSRAKRAAGRTIDLEDVRILEEADQDSEEQNGD